MPVHKKYKYVCLLSDEKSQLVSITAYDEHYIVFMKCICHKMTEKSNVLLQACENKTTFFLRKHGKLSPKLTGYLMQIIKPPRSNTLLMPYTG